MERKKVDFFISVIINEALKWCPIFFLWLSLDSSFLLQRSRLSLLRWYLQFVPFSKYVAHYVVNMQCNCTTHIHPHIHFMCIVMGYKHRCSPKPVRFILRWIDHEHTEHLSCIWFINRLSKACLKEFLPAQCGNGWKAENQSARK